MKAPVATGLWCFIGSFGFKLVLFTFLRPVGASLVTPTVAVLFVTIIPSFELETHLIKTVSDLLSLREQKNHAPQTQTVPI